MTSITDGEAAHDLLSAPEAELLHSRDGTFPPSHARLRQPPQRLLPQCGQPHVSGLGAGALGLHTRSRPGAACRLPPAQCSHLALCTEGQVVSVGRGSNPNPGLHSADPRMD